MHVFGPIALWWLALTLVGLAGLPFARLMAPTLPDLGIGVARPLGLLLVAFTWWWAVTLGLLPNSALGAWVSLLVVAALGWRLLWAQRHAAFAQWRSRWRRFAGLELLFLLALVAWALYRAFYPDVTQAGGEKTMELAFLNGILRSPRFPPNDPWMSGESISYYYFSYVMGALLVRITSLSPSVAFNLLVPGTLAMTLTAAFSMGANLVSLSAGATRRMALVVGGFAATLLALLGSQQGGLELGYRLGIPGRGFYRWLGVFDLGGSQAWADGAMAESLPGYCNKQDAVFNELARIGANTSGVRPGLLDLMPNRHIWWWRASRVIRDGCTEAIHEFPFFSFMLADAHPHVLALPFVLLAMTLALAVLSGATAHWVRGSGGAIGGVAWLLPIIVGATAFINTWDLPTYGALVLVAYGLYIARAPLPGSWPGPAALAARVLVAALSAVIGWGSSASLAGIVRRLITGTPTEAPLPLTARLLVAGAVALALWLGSERLRESRADHPSVARGWALLRFLAWMSIASWVLYLPFHLDFASQAAGVAQAGFSSRPAQWLVHWGLHYLLVLGAVAVAPHVAPAPRRLLRAWLICGLALALPTLSWLLELQSLTTILLAAISATVVLVPWPDRAGILGGGMMGARGMEPELSVATRRFLQSAVVVGAAGFAAWRISSPPAMTPDHSMGGAAGWTPWTPLMLALPLIALAAAGLDRWLSGAPAHESMIAPEPTDDLALDSDLALAAPRNVSPDPNAIERSPIGSTFAVMCLCLGLLMVLGTEFFYVRDIFNSRMNTIFKLHFQGWVLISIGGAYVLFAARRHLPRALLAPWLIVVALAVATATLYPMAATWDRTGGFAWPTLRGEGFTPWFERLSLDGLRYWETVYPGDLAAANWLNEQVEGAPTILEATGGGYSHTGRIAMATGLPTVLGADGHEQQWRGTREMIDPRKSEVESFYAGRMSEEQMSQVLERYDVEYVILGDHERSQHSVPATVEMRLARIATPVFQSGGMTVYRR